MEVLLPNILTNLSSLFPQTRFGNYGVQIVDVLFHAYLFKEVVCFELLVVQVSDLRTEVV